jgi:hypothetical protein
MDDEMMKVQPSLHRQRGTKLFTQSVTKMHGVVGYFAGVENMTGLMENSYLSASNHQNLHSNVRRYAR